MINTAIRTLRVTLLEAYLDTIIQEKLFYGDLQVTTFADYA